MSLFFLVFSALFAIAAGSAHVDYRASANAGGVLDAGTSRLLRNVFVVLSIIAGCVGGSLKAGGF